MPMNNPERALATVVGEVHGLFMAVQALVKTHPVPQQFLTEFEKFAQFGLAAIEPHPVPDAVVHGFQHVVAGIRQAAAVDRNN
jgi:hypothetical protein